MVGGLVSRLARAKACLAKGDIELTELDDGRLAYYAVETGTWWAVTTDELASLCDYLDDPDPAISRDAYSHWCTVTGEEIEGIEEVAS